MFNKTKWVALRERKININVKASDYELPKLIVKYSVSLIASMFV